MYNFNQLCATINATVLVSHAISDITSALIGVKTKENRTINAITEKEEKKEDGEEEERNILFN